MPITLDGTNGITTNSGTVISASTIGVGGATPSTSGAGITFPATQSASSDANTLDDYEEGTWTPTITFGGGSTGITYAVQSGMYTKVGRVVNVACYFQLANKGSSTGNLQIQGLPFTVTNYNSGNMYFCSAVWGNHNTSITGGYVTYMEPNTTYVTVCQTGTGTFSILTQANLANNSDFMINFMYVVA